MKKILLAVVLAPALASAQTFKLPVNLPLSFESASGNQFVTRGNNYEFQISPAGAEIFLQKTASETARVQMRMLSANPQAFISGESELPGKINYLVGDKSQWRTGISTFSKVRVAKIYPGIDLVYYGNGEQLEYDFAVAPGANPESIRFQFSGVGKIAVDAQGQLILSVGKNQVVERKPEIYQMIGGARREITGSYKILNKNTVAFAVGHYDSRLPLVIDPTLVYSSYFGGNGATTAWSVAVDADGYVYVAGETKSSKLTFKGGKFSTPGAYQTKFGGGKLTGDAFVAKFDNTLTNLIYCTYLGGSMDDGAFGVATTNGCAYVTGFTDSRNFPVRNALYPQLSGKRSRFTGVFPTDAFVAVLNTNGSDLLFSTYLGGKATDAGIGIALDSSANIYIAGITASANFPTNNSLPGLNTFQGADDAFVTEISNDFSGLAFSTYLGGGKFDEAEGIAVDGSGHIYLAGYTSSGDFPVTNVVSSTNIFQPKLNRGVFAFRPRGGVLSDAFVTKLMPSGAGFQFQYSTYLGGTNDDKAFGIAADSSGNAYVIGSTSSRDFWNVNTNGGTGTNVIAGLRTVKNNTSSDAFLTKFDGDGNLIYSVKFGGSGNDVGYGVTADAAGDAFITGATSSTNFPVRAESLSGFPNNPAKRAKFGAHDAFVAKISSDNANLAYSAYIGGRNNDFGYGITVDTNTNVYVVGETAAKDFPVVAPYQNKSYGTNSAFLIKIEP